jgi:alanine racemase
VKAPEILLDLEALRANFDLLSKPRAASKPPLALMPVVKANAYGHGALAISTFLEKHYSDERLPYFCVARWTELEELRRGGLRRPLLVLSQYSAEEISQSSCENVSLMVSSPHDLSILSDLDPQKRGSLSGVHIHFNTGMNRLGWPHTISDESLKNLFSRLLAMGLKVEGLSTHLARSEEDPQYFTNLQQNRFEALVERTRNMWQPEWGVFPRWIHAANSAGIFRNLGASTNAARPGLFLWGVHQDLDTQRELEMRFSDLRLRPILSLRAPLRDVYWVQEAEGVSYGHRYVAPSRRRVGVVSMGYADGLLRSLSRRHDDPSLLNFWIEGHAAPIIGTVTMDMTLVDLSEHPGVEAIAERVLTAKEPVWASWIGPEQPIEKHAEALGTISYEVLCSVSHRVKREVRCEMAT